MPKSKKQMISIIEKKQTEVFYVSDFSQTKNAFSGYKNKKIAIISPLGQSKTAERLSEVIKESGADVFIYKIHDGENCKTIENALKISNFLDENGFSRSDVIVNLGGGTVCDLGGFVASIYKRGVQYINIPTTLLCAVDAAIGGKTAIDCNGKKNQWGTFYQPSFVIIIGEILNKLSPELIEAGLSEIVKYAVIDADFCNYLAALSTDDFKAELLSVIQKCIEIKGRYIELDERDKNVRHALNAGHTVAHAIEMQSEFSVDHASAVMIGLITETEMSYKLNYIDFEQYNKLTALYEKYFGEYVKLDADEFENLIPFMQSDKKNENNKICFVLPYGKSVKTIFFGDEVREILK